MELNPDAENTTRTALDERTEIYPLDEKEVRGIDTYPHEGYSSEAVTISPYAPAIKALHKKREDARAALDEADRALAVIEPLHKAHMRQTANGAAPTPVEVQDTELAAMVGSQAAEVVLRRAHRVLKTAEIRALLEAGGKSIAYPALYKALTKKTRTFYKERKKWGLTEWQNGGKP